MSKNKNVLNRHTKAVVINLGIGVFLSTNTISIQAHQVTDDKSVELETMEVQEGRATDLIGIAPSASQGVVGQPEFKYRPMSRVGELVEMVPGAIATQHSGTGKANQFFLRGFNLDHGTDFSVNLDGIPMNMPSHAHGQGYLDLNSIIPELIDKVEYGKGPYYAEVGDFSSAGYSKMHTMHKLDQAFIKFTAGEYGFYRTVAANSTKIGPGDLLYAGEFNLYDGVWQQPEDLGKFNGMLRYTIDQHDWGLSVNGKAYNASWTATNQIPDRLVKPGILDLYGTMDPSDGGKSNRYSLSANLWNVGDSWKNDANIYALYSDLNLYSNFSGFTTGPQGDQIHQHERRVQLGGNIEHTRYDKWFGFEVDNTIGLQVRHDEIMGIALNATQQRALLNNVREDDISETQFGLYIKNETHWLEKFRTIAGLRGDFINNTVNSLSLSKNSGNNGGALLSPKLSMVFGPWYETDFFINMGYGYHSNDARGTTIKVDPTDSVTPLNRVSPFVWQRGGEVGVRSQYVEGLTTTLAVWWLQSSGELVFVGDAGTTEPTPKTARYGVEWTNYYKPTKWLTLDLDLAFTSARYVSTSKDANNIPTSVGRVISTGATVDLPNGLFGTVRLRHFGQIPLDEAGTFWGGETNILNIGAGYQRSFYKVEVDVFNILNSHDKDIAYAYDSAYPSGAATQYGLMQHPIEPRMIRGSITLKF